jgi:hypothetical protein
MVRSRTRDAKFGDHQRHGLYRFALLHPAEQTPQQTAENDRVSGTTTLGVEVTKPELAARCGLGNIDPQHSGGGDPRAAIEACLDWPLPPIGSWLVTIRPDLDALGGMALLALRRAGAPLTEALQARVAAVAQADTFANGPWPGPRKLPRDATECIAAVGSPTIATAAAAAADHNVPVADRVGILARWLETGEIPAPYSQAVERRARILAAALADGSLRVETVAGGRIAVVHSAVDGADRIGYLVAPVLVMMNPAFRFRGGAPHRKYTVCQYARGHVDLGAVARELAVREPGWGGSQTIIGSPQDVSSFLPLASVVQAVIDALR